MKTKYLIVVADYYQYIAKGLLDNALKLIPKSNLIKIIRVPGVFEIPVTISKNIKKGITPRVRVISSNVVQNYLINQELPNSFNKTLNYFKKFNNCVLVFIKDTNLKSVSQTLKDYKNKDFYKKGKDKLIRNYGIGAQIIKDLKIKNMTLISKSPKKVIGLEGYDIKITKQEII